MPHVVDYPSVAEQMAALGLVSLYPSSGAFGFPADAAVRSVGWVGPDDATIRPAACELVRFVAAPYEATLASMAARAWRDHLPGPVWVLPKAHWAYELTFGSAAWMPDLLRSVGLSPDVLIERHDGAAAEFSPGEDAPFVALVAGLLERLLGSDFMLAWPGRPVVCTVHHHKQLWWTTTDPALHATLDALGWSAGG